NMYLDRDIDTQMSRTRLRPIPSGRMRPRAVLAFGVALATAATFLLARFTNVLTALLALAGFYFYVFVYTRWLKRTTPQNIVIGGAAGAFPPLVGWAAVTGSIDLTAIYLFLIIFYWTPPHFWALALNKQTDYGHAQVPMAPLVWGERETKQQMLWYSIILVALTVLPWAFGALGVAYVVSALALGAVFLFGVVRVVRAESQSAPTRDTLAFVHGADRVRRAFVDAMESQLVHRAIFAVDVDRRGRHDRQQAWRGRTVRHRERLATHLRQRFAAGHPLDPDDGIGDA